MRKIILTLCALFLLFANTFSQINTDRVMAIAKNALYFEDYVLSIQYFNQIIKVKPFLAEPYFYRGVAKLYLEDYKGAEEDCSACIERNPYIVSAYHCRGVARQNLKDYKGAIVDYNKALTFDPENRNYLINKAVAFQQNKDSVNAEKAFDYLVASNPNYYNAYLSRGSFYGEKGDTLRALADLKKALSMDKYDPQAYATLATVYGQAKKYKEALANYNEAIKLDANVAGYYGNRAIVRYYLNDLRGTMADYDKVISMEPRNVMALYNRALLRMQVGDNNRAIEDFDKVLKQENDNYFAYYNRGTLRTQTGNFKGAIADFTKVINQYPDFLPAYSERAEARKKAGDMKGSEKDFWTVINLNKQADKIRREKRAQQKNEVAEDKVRKQSDKNMDKFKSLLVADETETEAPKYSNDTRGRVQDKNIDVEPEGLFVLTYYEKSGSVKPRSYFNTALDRFNQQYKLPHKLLLTNDEASLTEDQIKEHFKTIDELSKQIEHNPNDTKVYFARSLEFMLVQDFTNAIEDLTRVITIDPDFTLAFYNRAVIRYKQLKFKMSEENKGESELAETFSLSNLRQAKKTATEPIKTGKSNNQLEYEMILRDLDYVTAKLPKFIWAYFNRANVRCLQKDYRSALTDYDAAIRLESDFAEAYFNRGLVYFFLNENDKGADDLSKAGELGIPGAYNVIKRVK